MHKPKLYKKDSKKKFFTLVMILTIPNGFPGDAALLILLQEGVRLEGSN